MAAEYILEIDKKGRITLPEDLLNQHRIASGDRLVVRSRHGRIEVQKLAMTHLEQAQMTRRPVERRILQ
ncbi:MAG: AbrB/MazE/SpoVT family DNA-binding domain-containing protein [Bacillota bacterium]